MDRLARLGRSGLALTVPDGFPQEAMWPTSQSPYDPRLFYTGRPSEAASWVHLIRGI